MTGSAPPPPSTGPPADLTPLLPAYLARQRWFAGDDARGATVIEDEELVEGLRWLVVEVGGHRYQLVVGHRPADAVPTFLNGHDAEIVGELGDLVWYDALVDPELARCMLRVVAPHEVTTMVRPMGAEQSNSSLVYDDRLVLKLFRRLQAGANPDVEVTAALHAVGFDNVAAPVGTWRRGGTDLAVCQRYLAGGAEGWALALTSLRDLYATSCDDPADCGGDFGGEARRLGSVTARMHLALARSFGMAPGDVRAWGDMAEAQLATLQPGDADAAAAKAFLRRMHVAAAGASIRVHGDYHLGQVMRTDAGWFVLDFEGEPARPLEERALPSSPLKDVAGMLRSFQYAAQIALSEQDEAFQAGLGDLATKWEQRNRSEFLSGYLAEPGVGELLPPDPTSLATVLAAFELDKAVYEVRYERSHRPDWVAIPQAAIRRLLLG